MEMSCQPRAAANLHRGRCSRCTLHITLGKS